MERDVENTEFLHTYRQEVYETSATSRENSLLKMIGKSKTLISVLWNDAMCAYTLISLNVSV